MARVGVGGIGGCTVRLETTAFWTLSRSKSSVEIIKMFVWILAASMSGVCNEVQRTPFQALLQPSSWHAARAAQSLRPVGIAEKSG